MYFVITKINNLTKQTLLHELFFFGILNQSDQDYPKKITNSCLFRAVKSIVCSKYPEQDCPTYF